MWIFPFHFALSKASCLVTFATFMSFLKQHPIIFLVPLPSCACLHLLFPETYFDQYFPQFDPRTHFVIAVNLPILIGTACWQISIQYLDIQMKGAIYSELTLSDNLRFYCFSVIKHPNMKMTVIQEVERLIYRPNVAQKAQ